MLVLKQPWSMLAIFLFLITINGGVFAWAWLSSFGIVNENGPLENIQVLILSLALVNFVWIFSQQASAARTLAAVFCFVCVYLILKELDFRVLQAARPGLKSFWVENTLPEQIRKFLKLIGFLAFAVFLILRKRDIFSMVRAMISWSAWPYFLSFALLVLSLILEHPGFRPPAGLDGPALRLAFAEFSRSQAIGKFWEELVEMNAYLVLLYAAQSCAVISSLIGDGVNTVPARVSSIHGRGR